MGKTSFIILLILFNVIFVAFLAAIIIFIREYRIKKKRHLAQIHTIDQTHKKELLETQIEIQTATMKHIGREIHDNVGQKLTLASLYIQQLIFENKTPQINTTIDGINNIINESLQELRQLSKSLTDDYIASNDINKLLEQECQKTQAITKCTIAFLNRTQIDLESYHIKSVLYRITQEFLQNSMKHAHCKTIRVLLDSTPHAIILRLEDDGIGFDIDAQKSNGIGLQNIKKRAELIGGTLTLESIEKVGTTLILKIPL